MTKVKITGLPQKALGGTHYTDRIPGMNKKQMTYFGSKLSNPISDDNLEDSRISTSVKAIPEEEANIEAERGEILKTPDGKIYTIKGKPHTKGGTPLNVDQGSEIISNSPKVSILKDMKDLAKAELGLKIPSSNKPKDNTPAKYHMLNVGKDYNKHRTILEDEKQDSISRTTAQLMLGKYDENHNNVFMLQEAIKDKSIQLPKETLEQEQLEKDLAQNKQFELGGLHKYEVGDVFLGKKSDVNSQQSIEQAKQYEAVLRANGYDGKSILNLDYSQPHPEIEEAQKFAATHFGSEIANYLRTQDPSNKVKGMLNGRDINKISDKELLGAYPDAYWSWRGYIPGQNNARKHDQKDFAPNSSNTPYLTQQNDELKTIPQHVGDPKANFTKTIDGYQPIQRDREVDNYNNEMYNNEMVGNKVAYWNPSLHNTVDLRGQITDINPALNNINTQVNAGYRLVNSFATPQQAAMALAQSQGLDKANEITMQASQADNNSNLNANNFNSQNHNQVVNWNNDQIADMLNKNDNALANWTNAKTDINNKDAYRRSVANQDYRLSDWKRKSQEQLMGAVDSKGVIQYPHNPDGSFNPNYPLSFEQYQVKLLQSQQDNQSSLTNVKEIQNDPNYTDEQKKLIISYLTKRKS